LQYQLLERTQDNIEFAMGNTSTSKAFANILMRLADKCTSNVPTQQFVFTKIEQILGVDNVSVSVKQRAPLFTFDGTNLQDGPFLRAIRSNDFYTKRAASVGLATLLTVCDGEVNSLISWICEQLSSPVEGTPDIAIPALTILLRRESARQMYADRHGITILVQILAKLGPNGNGQQIYDICFCLWTLSLGDKADIPAFLASGSIRYLVDLLAAAPSRKVVRMVISTLRNLSSLENEDALTEMLTGSLQKLLEHMLAANAHKQAGDPELEADVRYLYDTLMRNYRDLSSYDRWVSEVHTGALRWGIVHTEKFWRENAKFVEVNDFKLLKMLIALLRSDDETIVCIALYDLGEFTRFYPNGRGVVKSLGGKDLAMDMIGSLNGEIQRQALQCVSKIMVTNWEFMR
jgi:V-type H+-transporting ATPase subunit H